MKYNVKDTLVTIWLLLTTISKEISIFTDGSLPPNTTSPSVFYLHKQAKCFTSNLALDSSLLNKMGSCNAGNEVYFFVYLYLSTCLYIYVL